MAWLPRVLAQQFPLVPTGSRWFPLVPTGSCWFPLVPAGFRWLPLVPTGSHWSRYKGHEVSLPCVSVPSMSAVAACLGGLGGPHCSIWVPISCSTIFTWSENKTPNHRSVLKLKPPTAKQWCFPGMGGLGRCFYPPSCTAMLVRKPGLANLCRFGSGGRSTCCRFGCSCFGLT